MSETRRPPGAGLIFKMTWSSLFTATKRMPILFIGVAALNVAFGLGEHRLLDLIVGDLGATGIGVGIRLAATGIVMFAGGACSLLALTLIAVAVHRLVLLDEVSSGLSMIFTKRVWRFAIWTLAWQILFVLVYAAAKASEAAAFVFLGYVLLALLGTRLILLFPAVAIDVPATTLWQRMEGSLEQTQGLFWLLFFSLVLSLLPLIAFEGATTLAAIYGDLATKNSPVAQMMFNFADVLSDLLEPFEIALTAAVASWVYMWRQENPVEAPALTQPPHEI